MSHIEPVDPRVRLAIVQWPDDAPRGSVTTFCAEHGISRKTLYAIRQRAREDGPAAALEPRTRRPRSSPNRISEEVKQQALGVRSALEASGLDFRPISVHEKMRTLRMAPTPSPASLARIFRDAGVARVEPRKKPRASSRRFVYPAPNACWQLVAYVTSLGVEPITGKPYKPTTQGNNERFHQTLFRWLDKQPLADTLEQLQEQVDWFDRMYNTERPHQALAGRITPQQAWEATPKTDPPARTVNGNNAKRAATRFA